MKNKIIAIFLLLMIFFTNYNFIKADSINNVSLPTDIPSFDEFYYKDGNTGNYLLCDGIDTNNGFLLYKNKDSYTYNLRVLTSSSDKFIVSGFNSVDVSVSEAVSVYVFTYNPSFDSFWHCDATNKPNALYANSKFRVGGIDSEYWTNCGIFLTDGSYAVEPNISLDDSIGDTISNLQLIYEYNEDFSECHIDATLKNGAFTDKIYYSNIAPSISGQGLITKKAFPSERFNSYRKSIFVFSSRG